MFVASIVLGSLALVALVGILVLAVVTVNDGGSGGIGVLLLICGPVGWTASAALAAAWVLALLA